MKQIIQQFYQAFKNLDPEAMAACYHDEIVFEDPAFGVLKGEKMKNMWRDVVSISERKKLCGGILQY